MTPLARRRLLAARCAARLPPRKRRHTQADREDAVRALAIGWDPAIVATVFGVTPQTLRRWQRTVCTVLDRARFMPARPTTNRRRTASGLTRTASPAGGGRRWPRVCDAEGCTAPRTVMNPSLGCFCDAHYAELTRTQE